MTDNAVEELLRLHDEEGAGAAALEAGRRARIGTLGMDALLHAVARGFDDVATVIAGALARHRLDETLATCSRAIETARTDGPTELFRKALDALSPLARAPLDDDPALDERRRAGCQHLLVELVDVDAQADAERALDLLEVLGARIDLAHWRLAACFRNWRERRTATNLLGRFGEEQDLRILLLNGGDHDVDVRRAAEHALDSLMDRRIGADAGDPAGALLARVEAMARLLRDSNPGVRADAITWLARAAPDTAIDRIRPWASDPEPHVRWHVAHACLSVLDGVPARARPEDDRFREGLDTLRTLARDPDRGTRHEAFRGLCVLDPGQAAAVAPTFLDDDDEALRARAVTAMADVDDPAMVDHLVPRCRDSDAAVRIAALTAIASRDDPRALGELVSALFDVHPDVVQHAEHLLVAGASSVPALARFPATVGGVPFWRHRADQVLDTWDWGRDIGRELLGKPIRIRGLRHGVGRTWLARKSPFVEIEISDAAVTAGHPDGPDILRGILLHELGHHLHDAGAPGAKSTRGIARSEGVQSFYDILLDERLERRLRSRRPEWGIYLDRLGSFVFLQEEQVLPLPEYARLAGRGETEVEAAIDAGFLPGRLRPRPFLEAERLVALTGREQWSLPGLLPPLMLFLVWLRCGLERDLCPDPTVREALDAVPAGLKDCTHRDVLATARRLGEILGKEPRHERDLAELARRLARSPALARALNRLLARLEATDAGPCPGAPEGDAPPAHVSDTVRRIPTRARRSRSPDGDSTLAAGACPPVNVHSGIAFPPLDREETLPVNPEAQARLAASIRKQVRGLRSSLERLGMRSVDEEGARRGHRPDLAVARRAAWIPRPGILVRGQDVIAPDAYVGILIDRSGSMEGGKLETAKAFGLLVAEAARGIRGLAGHVNAFDDTTFYRLGDFQRNSIASLEAGAGNNDSGALARAADLALRSGRRHRLLVMISDGSPSECSFESLKDLVARLSTRQGIVCAQAAVEPLREIAFPHYVDLSRYGLEEAVTRFGRLLLRLTAGWR